MICVQGALGIFRVDYNALHGRTFALVHGVFAQLVFAVLVSAALLTSRRWLNDRPENPSPALERWSIVTVLIVFGQLVLGGLVRHKDSLLGPRGHLLGAFLVVGAVVWLLKLIRECEGGEGFKKQRVALKAFLMLQLWLGVESWLAKFYVPGADLPQLAPIPMHAEWIRTAHYLLGTLIFATTVTVALLAHRNPRLVVELEPMHHRELEAAL
jgi:heme A synthase